MAYQYTVTTSVSTVVSFTPSTGWFTDAACTQAASFPASISSSTTWYTNNSGAYTLSAVYAGREYGGTVYVEGGTWPSTNILPQPGDGSSSSTSSVQLAVPPSASTTAVPVLTETFTAADGTALTGKTPDVGSHVWTANTGTFKMLNGTLIPNSNGDADYATIDTGLVGNFTIKAQITPQVQDSTHYQEAGLLFRWTAATSYFVLTGPYGYGGYGGATTVWTLYRYTSGTRTTIFQSQQAITSGVSQTVRVDAHGPDVTVTVNGVEIGTYTDTQGVASSVIGVRNQHPSGTTTTLPSWDNISVYPLQGAVFNWPHYSKNASNPVIPKTSATRTDTVGITSGSAVVTDPSCIASDNGKPLLSTTGIPTGTYVGTVTPGTSFLMSSSRSSQVNVNATATNASLSLTIGSWAQTDLNDPSVAYDPVNNRYVLAGTGYYNDGGNSGVQKLGMWYASSPDGPWTADPLNPVYEDPAAGTYDMNGGLIWYIDHWIYAGASGGGSTISFYTSTDLHTWTKLGLTISGSGWCSGGIFDPFLRLRQDGVTLECWFGGRVGSLARSLGYVTSVDGFNSYSGIPASPTIGPPPFDSGYAGASNTFSEPSVYVPPGQEGKQMLIHADYASLSTGTSRGICQAITVDGGATWHYRIASLKSAAGWDSAQNFDSQPVHYNGRMYLFYGGADINGLALNLDIQIGQQTAEWNNATLLVQAATG